MSGGQQPILSIRGLSKRFVLHHLGGREVTALESVDLDVHAGQHVCLAGTSGAGKSTLLKCIWRSYMPTAGQALLRRRDGAVVDLVALPDEEMAQLRQSELGYVGQFLKSEPRRRTFDVVKRAAERRGLAGDDAVLAAQASLTRVKLDHELWEIYPTLLSGGEKQRLNLAVGMIEPPRLLLLDEPMASLDPGNRESVIQLIEALAPRQVAVISVFHDTAAIRRLATRVVVVHHGLIKAEGPPDDVLALLPEETYVGALQ